MLNRPKGNGGIHCSEYYLYLWNLTNNDCENESVTEKVVIDSIILFLIKKNFLNVTTVV